MCARPSLARHTVFILCKDARASSSRWLEHPRDHHGCIGARRHCEVKREARADRQCTRPIIPVPAMATRKGCLFVGIILLVMAHDTGIIFPMRIYRQSSSSVNHNTNVASATGCRSDHNGMQGTRLRSLVFLTLLAGCRSGLLAGCTIRPAHLRLESLSSPVGVEISAPRFSWWLAPSASTQPFCKPLPRGHRYARGCHMRKDSLLKARLSAVLKWQGRIINLRRLSEKSKEIQFSFPRLELQLPGLSGTAGLEP